MKQIEKLEILLTDECGKYENDCTTCPYTKKCDEYARLASKESEVIK